MLIFCKPSSHAWVQGCRAPCAFSGIRLSTDLPRSIKSFSDWPMLWSIFLSFSLYMNHFFKVNTHYKTLLRYGHKRGWQRTRDYSGEAEPTTIFSNKGKARHQNLPTFQVEEIPSFPPFFFFFYTDKAGQPWPLWYFFGLGWQSIQPDTIRIFNLFLCIYE